VDYNEVSSGKLAVGTQLLSHPGSWEHLDADLTHPWEEKVPPPGRDATLLAVVPIPGTGTSLAIVGYAIATSDTVAGATPADSEPQAAKAQAAKAQAAKAQSHEPAAARKPGLRMDQAQRRVWAGGREVRLTYQEFELLAFLHAHPATVFSRADLVEQVWRRDLLPDAQAAAREARKVAEDSRTVDVHISRVRHKLGPLYGQCLVTEYRAGYRFRPPAS
jgi:DNA-binding winged helix-turn-helix (wHTH) protein